MITHFNTSVNNTSSQIELVYGKYSHMENHEMEILKDFLSADQNVFTTVSIEEPYFKRTTENLCDPVNPDEFDIIVPLKIKKRFSKAVNIKSIKNYVPRIIID